MTTAEVTVRFDRAVTDDELAVLAEQRAGELARLLREVAAQLETGPDWGITFRLRDREGKQVGTAVLREHEGET